ncbi:MAG: glycine cleavage system protein H [Flavobacteriales bacterium]|nr:glycine cleavage system protein H [Flavobacteriales bacterium]
MNIPENLKYTKDHEWILIEDNYATIGITDFAQSELGDIVYVECDTQGESLEAESVFGTVEAVKTVSDLFMPVSGSIQSFNEKLEDTPEIINEDPYGDGWMIKIKISNPKELLSLLDFKAYEGLLKGE